MPLSITDTPPPATGRYVLACMIVDVFAPVDATPVIDTETLWG